MDALRVKTTKIKSNESCKVVLQFYSDMVKLTDEALRSMLKGCSFRQRLGLDIPNGENDSNILKVKCEKKLDFDIGQDSVTFNIHSELSGSIEIIMLKGMETELVAIVQFESQGFSWENSMICEGRSPPSAFIIPDCVTKYINKKVESMKSYSYIVKNIMAKGCKCYLKSFFISNYVNKSEETIDTMKVTSVKIDGLKCALNLPYFLRDGYGNI